MRIILVSKAAGGKDFFRDFLNTKYAVDVSYTTRPQRKGEIPDYTYHYLSEEKFQEMVDNNAFLEHVRFNKWGYGTSMNSWKHNQVFIFTPSGVKCIPKMERKDCIIVYFDIDENLRRKRLELRSDADKTERRLEADREDFKDFKDFDIRITNPLFSCDALLKLIKDYEITNRS